MDFNRLADEKALASVTKSLMAKGYEVFVTKNGPETFDKIKNIIPDGSTVMNGSSVTLEQIGFIELLKSGNHKWVNLHAKVNAESDQAKRNKLRKEATLSDYYLGSVHALTQDGTFVIASNTGSQLPHVVYTSQNLIFVVSTKKIVKDLPMAVERVKEHCVPLEDKHLLGLYNMHTALNKLLIFYNEAKMSARKIYFLLVTEDLGF